MVRLPQIRSRNYRFNIGLKQRLNFPVAPLSSTKHFTMAPENYSFVLQKVKEFSYENRKKPTITQDDDIIVQIKSTGICGSDVHFYTHGRIGDFVMESPFILGHESAGIVTEVGSGVTSVEVGDKVCIEPGKPCYKCIECLEGQYNHCADMRFAATPPIDGTLTKYYKVSEPFCYKLPENMSFDEGALIEPLSVAVHSMEQAGLADMLGSNVIVFGCGPVGLLIAAVARSAGASLVVIVDVNENRLKFARETFGVETHLSEKGKTSKEAALDLVKKYNLRRGFNYALDASGVAYCAQTAIYSLKPRGTFVQVGMSSSDGAELPLSTICGKEINVTGCFRYNAGNYRKAIDLVSRGVINAKALVSARYKFSEAEEAFEQTRQGKGIKIIISGPE